MARDRRRNKSEDQTAVEVLKRDGAPSIIGEVEGLIGTPHSIGRKKRMLHALESSLGVVSYACAVAEVSRSTYYSWMEMDEVFAKKVEEVTEFQLDYVENRLLQNIRKEDVASIIFYLKTKGRGRGYSERHQLEHFGPDGGPINHHHSADKAFEGALQKVYGRKVDANPEEK